MSNAGKGGRDDGVAVEDAVRAVFRVQGFAMLATEGEGGQPHASLMAFAPLADLRSLVFATYRGTRKYGNVVRNPRVALLIDGRHAPGALPGAEPAVTVIGAAHELSGSARDVAAGLLLVRHPELVSFLREPACALLRVDVSAYQLVRGVDDVRWWRLAEPAPAAAGEAGGS